MKVRCSTEIVLDDFLKLPRTAQLMFFEKMNDYTIYNNPYILFDIISFDTNGCKSPIEQILLFAFNIRVFERLKEFKSAIDFCLVPQKEIKIGKKKYFADLYFDAEEISENCEIDIGNLKLVIECDGHDYHHASKQQVKKDYERETDLKLAGYDILRFTGSQIYGDPYRCADTIIDYIKSKTNIGAHSNE